MKYIGIDLGGTAIKFGEVTGEGKIVNKWEIDTPSDVITAMDGKEIGSYEDLVSVKKSYKAGDTVTLTVYRDDAEITVDLTFDVQPENTEEDVPVQSTPDQGNDYFGQMPQMPDNYGDLFRWFFGNQW